MDGFAPAAFWEAAIMAFELSMPWILPLPVARVLANWRGMTPSIQYSAQQYGKVQYDLKKNE